MQFAQEHSDKIVVLDRAVAAARLGLQVLGLASMTALTVMFFRPELTDQIKVLSPYWSAPVSGAALSRESTNLPERSSETPAPAALTDAGNDVGAFSPTSAAAQTRVTGWLAKRHRVAGAASKMLVDAAYVTGKDADIDPLLILSVMSIQSRLNPFAENTTGAHGLMQVMTDVHKAKFDDAIGTTAVQEPAANLRVGAVLLKQSIRHAGSIEAGLKRYVGADAQRSDGGYTARVLGEYARLQAVASGRYVAATKAPAAPANATARGEADKSKASAAQPA
jgi:soluble lytic murein transglycosylase-like protein